jgi:hypothetical protein
LTACTNDNIKKIVVHIIQIPKLSQKNLNLWKFFPLNVALKLSATKVERRKFLVQKWVLKESETVLNTMKKGKGKSFIEYRAHGSRLKNEGRRSFGTLS